MVVDNPLRETVSELTTILLILSQVIFMHIYIHLPTPMCYK